MAIQFCIALRIRIIPLGILSRHRPMSTQRRAIRRRTMTMVITGIPATRIPTRRGRQATKDGMAADAQGTAAIMVVAIAGVTAAVDTAAAVDTTAVVDTAVAAATVAAGVDNFGM